MDDWGVNARIVRLDGVYSMGTIVVSDSHITLITDGMFRMPRRTLIHRSRTVEVIVPRLPLQGPRIHVVLRDPTRVGIGSIGRWRHKQLLAALTAHGYSIDEQVTWVSTGGFEWRGPNTRPSQ